MSLLSSASPSYLGIDLGLGGVKIVELRNNKGRAQLLTYGFAEEADETNHENYFANTKRLSAIIKKICNEAIKDHLSASKRREIRKDITLTVDTDPESQEDRRVMITSDGPMIIDQLRNSQTLRLV